MPHRYPHRWTSVALLLALAAAAGADEAAERARAAADRYRSAVVQVEATTYVNVERLPGVTGRTRRSHHVATSGVVVSDDGLVVFPARALDPTDVFALLGTDATAEVLEVAVVGADGRTREAEWLGRAARGGLAFCRVGEVGRAGLEPVTFAAAAPALGEPLLVVGLGPAALGRPLSVDHARVAFVAEDLLGTSPRLPHALGGLVVGPDGAAVGVLGAPPLGEGSSDADILRPDVLATQRAGYVVPAAVLQPAIAQPPRETGPATGGRRQRSWLGVEHQVVTPELAEAEGLDLETGIRLTKLYEGGPAAEAGLRVGDVLLSLDGMPLDLDPGESFDDLVGDYPPGSRVAVEVRRGSETKQLEVDLEKGPTRPEYAARMALPAVGVLLRELTFYDRQELDLPEDAAGVVVVELQPDGAASRAALQPGDVILAIDGQPVAGLEDARERLSAEGTHPITVRRRGQELTLRVRR